MPITITPIPGSSSFIGWGTSFDARTDFIGPIGLGAVWRSVLSISSEPGDNLWQGRITSQVNPTRLTIGIPAQTDSFGQWQAKPGDTVHLTTELDDALGNTLDSGTTTFVWGEASTTMPATIQWNQQTSGGGLTVEEHGWLDRLQQTIANTVAYGGTLATQVLAGGIFEHPAMGLLQPCDPVMRLTGEGILSRPAAGVGVEAYGLVLTTPVSPPGAGLLNGSLVQWTVRTIQLSTWHRASNGATLYPTEVLNLQVDTFAWTWRNAFPQEIHFSVTPGFEIDAQWLCWIINP